MSPLMFVSMASTEVRAWGSEHGGAAVQEGPLPGGEAHSVVVTAAFAAVGATTAAPAAITAKAVVRAVLVRLRRRGGFRGSGVMVLPPVMNRGVCGAALLVLPRACFTGERRWGPPGRYADPAGFVVGG